MGSEPYYLFSYQDNRPRVGLQDRPKVTEPVTRTGTTGAWP